MIIRLATEEDLRTCGRIYAEAFAGPPYGEVWDEGYAASMLAELFKKDPESCWCVEEDGGILGFGFCTTYGRFRAIIQEFAVSPNMQKKGIGSRLMQHILAEFNARGIQTAELVVHRKAPALGLYRKFGFRLPRNYILMVKSL